MALNPHKCPTPAMVQTTLDMDSDNHSTVKSAEQICSTKSMEPDDNPKKQYTKHICNFSTLGNCAVGDLCPVAHDSQEKANSCGDSQNIDKVTGSPDDSSSTKKLSYSQLAGINTGNQTKFIHTASQLNPTDLPFQRLSIIQPASKPTAELCVFAVTGKCRFGHMCRNLHGLQCPRCLLYCLHPIDLEQNETHIQECLEKPVKDSNADAEEIECGICLEKVLSKPDPRFGLLNCQHAFCLACIRQWRASAAANTATPSDPTTVRSCPLCRTVTYFIIPCSQYIRDGEEKSKIIEAYKRKVQAIPCKHYDYGRARCPFGSSCFYSHMLPDGTLAPPDLPRSYVDCNEQVKVVREFRLGDFLPGNHATGTGGHK